MLSAASATWRKGRLQVSHLVGGAWRKPPAAMGAATLAALWWATGSRGLCPRFRPRYGVAAFSEFSEYSEFSERLLEVITS